ncbi:hypothetical protein [Streptomyces sp. NPDC059743]|uniref:hypothetical protein n=1 Tax=Streptomyces sp. NPDC059743 TaxID=3346928 RepID=UPI00365E8FEA
MCPKSSAWATKTRLEQTRVIKAADMAAGRTVVRSCGSWRAVLSGFLNCLSD